MNCEQSQNLFDAYLDKSLSGSLATEFGAHQLACGRCRRELALLEVTGHVIATDSETPLLSDEFTERLVECATEKPARRPLRFSRALWVGLPAAMAACLILFVWLNGDETSEPADPANDGPRVLGVQDEVKSSEELLEHVLEALKFDPNNADLKRKADLLRSRSNKIINDTRDGASLLQDYSEDAIKELIGSVPTGANSNATDTDGGAVSESHSGSQNEAMQRQDNGSGDSGTDERPAEEL